MSAVRGAVIAVTTIFDNVQPVAAADPNAVALPLK
jgi:hypothetical protein